MEPLNFGQKLEEIKQRQPVTKAKTYTADIMNPYEKNFNWDNKTYFQDKMRLYAICHQFTKSRIAGESDLTKMLEWAKHKDEEGKTLHIRQFTEALRKIINRID